MTIFVEFNGMIFATPQERIDCILLRKTEISVAVKDFNGIIDEKTGNVKVMIYSIKFSTEDEARKCFRSYYKACLTGAKAFFFSANLNFD